MEKLALFYYTEIKGTRLFSELSEEEKKYLFDSFSYKLFEFKLAVNSLKRILFDSFTGIFRRQQFPFNNYHFDFSQLI